MNVRMNPVLLTFSDRAIETDYQGYRAQKFYPFMDKYVALLHFVVFFFFRNLIIHVELRGWVITYLMWLTIFSQLAMAFGTPPRVYAAWRAPVIFIIRITQDLCCLVGLPVWISSPVSSQLAALKQIIVASGVFMQNWQALSMPLPFRIHVAMQLAATTAYSSILNPSCCAVLLESKPVTLPLLQTVWNVLKAIAQVSSISGINTIITPIFWQHFQADDMRVCLGVMLMTQLAVGAMLPTAILFVEEMHSRQIYLENVQRRQGVHVHQLDTPMWVYMAVGFLWVLRLTLLLSVVWQVVLALVW